LVCGWRAATSLPPPPRVVTSSAALASITVPPTLVSIVVLACYVVAAIFLGLSGYRAPSQAAHGNRLAGLGLSTIAIVMHAVELWTKVFSRSPLALNLADSASMMGCAIAVIALLVAWRKPRFAGISALLLAIVALAAGVTDDGSRNFVVESSGWELTAHIALSALAYALISVGTALAIALGILNRRLRSRRPLGWLVMLPSVEALESGMFTAIGIGFALLSLSLFSGLVFVQDIRAQHLGHKMILSFLAWGILAILLIGHWRFGWRGRIAVNWTVGGFVLLGLAYFGSKIVLESILGRHWG